MCAINISVIVSSGGWRYDITSTAPNAPHPPLVSERGTVSASINDARILGVYSTRVSPQNIALGQRWWTGRPRDEEDQCAKRRGRRTSLNSRARTKRTWKDNFFTSHYISFVTDLACARLPSQIVCFTCVLRDHVWAFCVLCVFQRVQKPLFYTSHSRNWQKTSTHSAWSHCDGKYVRARSRKVSNNEACAHTKHTERVMCVPIIYSI